MSTEEAKQKNTLNVPPVVINGATGTLGRAFARLCDVRGIPYVLLTRQDMDISDAASVEKALRKYQPWAVINTAGYVRVDDAEQDAEACYQGNTHGPAVLAQQCHALGIKLVTFSSDLVFDGAKNAPYTEEDQPNPLNVYGHSKALAEEQVLTAMPEALVIRTSAFFGPWDEHNFVYHALRAIAHQETFKAASDLLVTPTYIPDLVNTTLDLLIDGEHGIWHVANQGTYTWAELAEVAANLAGLDSKPYLQPVPHALFEWAAVRPATSVLGTSKRAILPTVDDALQRFLRKTEFSFRPLQPTEEEAIDDQRLLSAGA